MTDTNTQAEREKLARTLYEATPTRQIHPEPVRIISWDEVKAEDPKRAARAYREADAIAALSSPPAGQGEPVAFAKYWWSGGRRCFRVDLSEINESWLEALRPEVQPLYALPQPNTGGEVESLRAALIGLLDNHVALVSCGDCGSWDVEAEPEVVAARAALSQTSGTGAKP